MTVPPLPTDIPERIYQLAYVIPVIRIESFDQTRSMFHSPRVLR
jgi:hypothetical protein